jgi:hypothetical protein
MGTFGELDGNTLGTTKMKNFPSAPSPPQNRREKNKALPSFSMDV